MDITITGRLVITDGGQTVSVSPLASIGVDLLAPEQMLGDRQSASTTIAAINLGSVGWSAATWMNFSNDSEVAGEDIVIMIPSTFIAGGLDNGTVAGASVPSTMGAAGYFQQISADGTSQSKTWKKGDYAVYLGASGTYFQHRPKRFILKPGNTAGPFRIDPDGGAWQFYSTSGTPQIQKVVAGPLAE